MQGGATTFTSSGQVGEPNISGVKDRVMQMMSSTPGQVAMYAGASPALEVANRAAAGVPPLNMTPNMQPQIQHGSPGNP